MVLSLSDEFRNLCCWCSQIGYLKLVQQRRNDGKEFSGGKKEDNMMTLSRPSRIIPTWPIILSTSFSHLHSHCHWPSCMSADFWYSWSNLRSMFSNLATISMTHLSSHGGLCNNPITPSSQSRLIRFSYMTLVMICFRKYLTNFAFARMDFLAWKYSSFFQRTLKSCLQ